MVGEEIYEKFIRGYTEKQWGRPCHELPAFIIDRIPLRFIFDNNYFYDNYQGIPIDGYASMIKKMIEGIEVKLNTDYLENCEHWNSLAKFIVYTGHIDAYFDYLFGALAYRSVRFEIDILECQNFQGNAVVNYNDVDIPFTRIIEHKYFAYGQQPHTVISKEYSVDWQLGMEPYYPVNDNKNNTLYEKYRKKS